MSSQRVCGEQGEWEHLTVPEHLPRDFWTTFTKTMIKGKYDNVERRWKINLFKFKTTFLRASRPTSSSIPNLSVIGRSYSNTDLNG